MLRRIGPLLLLFTGMPSHGVSEADIVAVLQPRLAQVLPDAGAAVHLKPLPAFVLESSCDDLHAEFRVSLFDHSGSGPIPVQIRCQQPRQWSAYISASVAMSQQVITACRSLPRNRPLRASDLCAISRPAETLRSHVLHQANEAQGMSLKRPLTKGAVIYRSVLTPSTLIERGDSVVIQSRRGKAVIAVRGTALQTGSHGEQISVRNSQSGRKLAGWILAPGLVSASGPPAAEDSAQDFSQIDAKVSVALADTQPENPAIVGNPMHNE